MSVEVEEEAVNSAYLRYILRKLLFIIFVLNQNVVNVVQKLSKQDVTQMLEGEPDALCLPAATK